MVCGKCGIEKDCSEFYVKRKHCKKCVRERVNAKYTPGSKKYSKEYYEENKERIFVNQNKYRKKNPEKYKYKERHREYSRQYRENNKERIQEQDRNRYAKNKVVGIEKKLKRRSMLNGTFTNSEWVDLCNKYNNICVCCGNSKILTVDHIVPISKGGANTIDNIQPLCRSCNSKKGVKIIDYR